MTSVQETEWVYSFNPGASPHGATRHTRQCSQEWTWTCTLTHLTVKFDIQEDFIVFEFTNCLPQTWLSKGHTPIWMWMWSVNLHEVVNLCTF